jgi:hypothetical protein
MSIIRTNQITDTSGNGTPSFPNGGIGKVLQAVSIKVGTGTGISPNANNVWKGTNFARSIQPTSSSSKILVLVNALGYMNGGQYLAFNIYRHSGILGVNATVAGTQLFNNISGFGHVYGNTGDRFGSVGGSIIDSPNTTSTIYYNLVFRVTGSGGIWDGYNGDSCITLLEVGL